MLTSSNVYCYYDSTGSEYRVNDGLKTVNGVDKAVGSDFAGSSLKIDCRKALPDVSRDVVPILAIHRTHWESLSKEKRIDSLKQFCQKDGNWTLLVVFTGGRDDNYPEDDEWREKYVGTDFPAERLCVLLDAELVNVIPKMAPYLRETPLADWWVDAFWQGPVLPKCLTALSLLCQGFLAVQCGPDGKAKDGFKVEVPDTRDKIVDALREMKWGEVILSDGLKCSLDPRLSVADRTGRDALRIKVSSPEFWAVFDETETKKLADAIRREWEALCGGEKFNDSCTHRLIEALPLKAGARVGEDFPTLVAEAYIELAGRLGRTE